MSGISTLIRALNYVEKATQTDRVISDHESTAVDGIMNLHKPCMSVIQKKEVEVIIISDSEDEDEPYGMVRLPKRPSSYIKIQSGIHEKKTTMPCHCRGHSLPRKLRRSERKSVVNQNRKNKGSSLQPLAIYVPVQEMQLQRIQPVYTSMYCLVRNKKARNVASDRPLNTGHVRCNHVPAHVVDPKQCPELRSVMYAVRRKEITSRMVAIRAPPVTPGETIILAIHD